MLSFSRFHCTRKLIKYFNHLNKNNLRNSEKYEINQFFKVQLCNQISQEKRSEGQKQFNIALKPLKIFGQNLVPLSLAKQESLSVMDPNRGGAGGAKAIDGKKTTYNQSFARKTINIE